MILKTGANYQAEGGYIEASREGDNNVTVKTETEKIRVPVGGSEYYAMYNVLVSNNTQSQLILGGFHSRGDIEYNGNDIVGISAGASAKVGILKNATRSTYIRAIITPGVSATVQPQTIKYVTIDGINYLEVSTDYNGDEIVVEAV